MMQATAHRMPAAEMHLALFGAAHDEVVQHPANADAIVASFKTTAGGLDRIEPAAEALHAQLGTSGLQTLANTVRTDEMWAQFGIEQKRAAKAEARVIASNRPANVRKATAEEPKPRNDN